LEKFPEILKSYVNNGILPEDFKGLSVNTLGDINQDGMSKDLAMLLKRTDEGAFSKSIIIADEAHVFYVNKKDLVESELFTKEKEKIKAILLEKRSKQVSLLWFKNEIENHFIKKNI